MMEDGVADIDEYHCILEDDPLSQYPVDLPPDFVSNHQQELDTGRLYVEITDAVVQDYQIVTSSTTQFLVNALVTSRSYSSRPNLYHHRGRPRVAVVRVSTSDSTPTVSKARMQQLLDGSTTSFVTQMRACSNGALQFQSAGIIDVKVHRPVSQTSAYQLAIDASHQVPRDTAEFILFCLPPGTPGSWIATANSFHYRSWYNDKWCTSLSAIMHELGHNIGLSHASREGGAALSDTSGYMGYSQRDAHHPLKCYTSANHWDLGWWDDQTVVFQNRDIHWLLRLEAFAHVGNHLDDRVLLNVHHDLYVMYNKAVGMNQDSTSASRNQLTVVKHKGDGGSTELVANLNVGQVYTADSGVKIKACRTAGSSAMIVSVGEYVDCDATLFLPDGVEYAEEEEAEQSPCVKGLFGGCGGK